MGRPSPVKADSSAGRRAAAGGAGCGADDREGGEARAAGTLVRAQRGPAQTAQTAGAAQAGSGSALGRAAAKRLRSGRRAHRLPTATRTLCRKLAQGAALRHGLRQPRLGGLFEARGRALQVANEHQQAAQQAEHQGVVKPAPHQHAAEGRRSGNFALRRGARAAHPGPWACGSALRCSASRLERGRAR